MDLPNLFLSRQFIPHGHCYLWQPELVWLHVISDTLIALAYYSIPLMLVYFVRKRRDIPFDWIFLMFSTFIVACGTTHVMAIWTLWHPTYWFSGLIKAVTALVSMSTAMLLLPLIPQALALPSPKQIELTNINLAAEMLERVRMQEMLSNARDELEIRIQERTAELQKTNESLHAEIRERQRVESALRESEQEIKASLQEKEVLLKEIHHRVKNNLQIISSLLNLQSEYIHDKQDLEFFKLSQNRIESMALIHEKLYQSKDLARIEFAEYVRDLVASLFSSYEVNLSEVTSRIDIDQVFLSIDAAIPCGLIINELVLNSLKHAFPKNRSGIIYIKLSINDEKKCILTISDNGIGFPAELDFRNTDSLGLQLVNALTKQLGGDIELHTDSGTQFTITFTE